MYIHQYIGFTCHYACAYIRTCVHAIHMYLQYTYIDLFLLFDSICYSYIHNYSLHTHSDGSDVTAALSGDSTVRTGDDISLMCVGTGYPQVSVSFTYSGLTAPVTLDDEVVMAIATPTTPYMVIRNITVKGLTIRDCGQSITCAVNATIGGVTKQASSKKEIDVVDSKLNYVYI